MMRELRIEHVAIERLKLDPRNPRAHSEWQIKQIARSIKAFGFNVPILADQDGNLLAGHGRVHAAGRLGLRDIPVIRLEHLTPQQALAYSIAAGDATNEPSYNKSQGQTEEVVGPDGVKRRVRIIDPTL